MSGALHIPGGLHYLHVEKPNLGERLETLMSRTSYVCNDQYHDVSRDVWCVL